MKTRTKVLWIFLGTVAITVGSLLLFIQSKYFATILKDVARQYMPTDFGVSGNFSELSVKLIPPGVVIKNPSIILKEKNPVGLPAGTKLDAQFIDVTFQLFQLIAGAITINAFAIHGASLKLDLDEAFFAAHEQPQKPKFPGSKFSWDSLVRFNFRSVSLVDSQVDIRINRENAMPVHVQSYAKELTIGRSTVGGLPSYDLAIDLQKAFMEIGGFSHPMSQFQASVELSAAGAMIRNLGVQDGELNVHTNGQIRGDLLKPKSLKSDLNYIVRGRLQDWLDPTLAGRFVKLPKNTPLEGLIAVEGKLSGDLMDAGRTLEAKAEVQLEQVHYSDWVVEKALIKGGWKSSTITLDSADFELGHGKVHVGKVAYDLHDRGQSVPVSLELADADFRRLLGPAIRSAYQLHMFLTGKVEAEITPGPEFGFEGGTELTVRDFSFDNQKPNEKRPLRVLLAVPEIGLKSKFSFDSDGFKFEQTEANLPNSHLKASGKVDSIDGFDIDVRGPVNLSDIRKLSAFEIGGEGQLHWTIKGKKPDVVFSFEAELEDACYLNLKLGNVKGKVVYNDGNDLLYFYDLTANQGRSQFIANGTVDTGASDAANMTVQVPKGTIQDFAAVFDNFLKKSVPWYPRDLSGQMSGVIKVSGKTPLDQLSVEGDMEMANVDYLHETFRNGKVHGGYRRGAYVAENIFIRKKNGAIRGNLVYGADDVMRFDFHSDGMSTLDIDRLASLGIPYRAPITIDTQGVGKLGSLKSSFHMNFGDGVIKTYSVPHSEIAFNTENGRVRGDVSIFAGQVKGRMDVGWEHGSGSSIDIDANHFDFQPILIGLNTALADDAELDSEVTGSAHLKFQTGALSKLSGSVALNTYLLRRHGYSLSLVKPMVVDIQNGNYQFTGLKFAGDGTQMTVNGRVQDGNIDYAISGHFNLGVFEFPVAEIAAVRGSADVNAKAFGRADSPRFKASIAASGYDLWLRDIEQPFEDGQFKVDWTDGFLSVTDIAAKFAGGTVKGQGTAQLYPYKVPDLDFKMDLANPKVKVYPVAYARTSGRLELKGTELPYKVKGSLNVAEALIQENFNLQEGARALRTSKFLPQKTGGGVGEVQVFDLDVDISADRNMFVRNDLFDTELKGNIKIVNSLQTPRVLGQATVIHGRLLFKDNFFTIQSGNLFFKNPAALDPEFDLSGQLDTKGYKVLLVASGSASSPNIAFTSQPPLSQNDIVSLLTLGVTSTGYQNIARENRDAYSRDELYGLLFSQSGVNKGLQQKLGVKVRVDNSQLVVPENAFRRTSTDATETVAPKVVVQKEVTKNLNASVGSTVGVGDNQEKNVNLEYDLNKHWSVLGTYEDQHGAQPSQSRTSVGADLKYKLRF